MGFNNYILIQIVTTNEDIILQLIEMPMKIFIRTTRIIERKSFEPNKLQFLMFQFSDFNTYPSRTKYSRSRPLRSPKTTLAVRGKDYASKSSDRNIYDSVGESFISSSVSRLNDERNIQSSLSQDFWSFLYDVDWLDKRKIPVTALTKDFGKSHFKISFAINNII